MFEAFLTDIFPVADTNAMELTLQKLRHFLKETGNAGAISDLFDGFYRTATYYSQARLTLSLGSRQLGCLYTYGEYASRFCFPSPPSNIWNIKTAELLIKKRTVRQNSPFVLIKILFPSASARRRALSVRPAAGHRLAVSPPSFPADTVHCRSQSECRR